MVKANQLDKFNSYENNIALKEKILYNLLIIQLVILVGIFGYALGFYGILSLLILILLLITVFGIFLAAIPVAIIAIIIAFCLMPLVVIIYIFTR